MPTLRVVHAHVVVHRYMCRPNFKQAGLMTVFFMLQPPLIVLQEAVRQLPAVQRLLAAQAALPATSSAIRRRWFEAVEVVVTLGIILVCAELAFWPPMESCHVDLRGLSEVTAAIKVVAGVLGYHL